MNIAVFASHNGSDLQAIIDGCKGFMNTSVLAVISNNRDAFALERARKHNINSYHISEKILPDPNDINNEIMRILEINKIDVIFLAGYLKKLGQPIIQKYKGRIFNIHPALLPKFGGKGMYGINVHKAVIEAGEIYSGITVHRVDEEYDNGEIVAQTKVDVLNNDTADSLADRILEKEHTFLVEILSDIINGKIKLE
ncbi:MAG: phosphoribosylglycinamide formyltransferase [Firmicutes bacterium HGW-Firmicutes-21]|nr:MAG: phosphoribosylglycinamide formyltransferase [Firmicutes bacterium HGW-Firmicutes-21]